MKFNIVSGDEMSKYASQLGITGNIIVFSEAIISGVITEEAFSDAFIAQRSKNLNLSPDKYRKKFASLLKLRQNDEIHLWFGEDLFCQLNVICVVSYLESVGIEKAVFHVIFEDEMRKISEFEISTKGFREIYRSVIINHSFVPTGIDITDKALALYADYLDNNGIIACFIKDNKDDSVLSLTIKLIKSYASYGLGDVQCKELIERVRNSQVL